MIDGSRTCADVRRSFSFRPLRYDLAYPDQQGTSRRQQERNPVEIGGCHDPQISPGRLDGRCEHGAGDRTRGHRRHVKSPGSREVSGL